jgi:hypothetical protein
MSDFMESTFGFIALSGFVLPLAAHVAALIGMVAAERVPFVWALHVGIFIVFIPFVLSSRKTLGKKPRFAEIRALFPGWIVVIGVTIFAYAIVNFVVFISLTEGGSTSIQDGKFVLLNHGKLIRELTQAEYHFFKTNEVRGISGHWLVFYFMPFAYFLFRNRANSPVELRPPASGEFGS